MNILALAGAEQYYAGSDLLEHLHPQVVLHSPTYISRICIEDNLQIEPDEILNLKAFRENFRSFISQYAPRYWFNSFIRILRFVEPGTRIVWIDNTMTEQHVELLKTMLYEVTTIGIGSNIPLQVPDITWPEPLPTNELASFATEHFGLLNGEIKQYG